MRSRVAPPMLHAVGTSIALFLFWILLSGYFTAFLLGAGVARKWPDPTVHRASSVVATRFAQTMGGMQLESAACSALH